MLKTTFAVLTLLAAFFWTSDVKISFHPFRIQMPAILNAIGYALLFAGVILIGAHNRLQGSKEAYKQGVEDFFKALKNTSKDNNETKGNK